MSVLDQLKNKEETVWLNPEKEAVEPRPKINGYGFVYVKAAQNRFMRFLPYIAAAFPETAKKKGIIESGLLPAPHMKEWLNANGANIQGKLFIKDDAHLPIAGSVKARGGIHEVLHIAESVAHKGGLLNPTDNYGVIYSDRFREFYSQYTIQVGSTGNLGVSIGRMARSFGFRVIVHMSSDAKEWKKELLRSEGAIVKEYDGDYSQAVAKGRAESAQDEKSFFIDDENSEDLFFGYATAGLRIKVQLFKAGVSVGKKHPLFVYIPCGVGGAPSGITFGLKQMYGDDVHVFFAEPVEAPCITIGMASGQYENICVQDIGLSGKTIADGLAVGRPSGFSCKMMRPLVSGTYTVSDEELLKYQAAVLKEEKLRLEPSACAGFHALMSVEQPGTSYEEYIKNNHLEDLMSEATHVVWATGGGLMPETE